MKIRFSVATLLIIVSVCSILVALTKKRQQLLERAEAQEFHAHVQHMGSNALYASPGDMLAVDTDKMKVKLVAISGNELTFQYRHTGLAPNFWLTHIVELEVQERSRRQFGYAWFRTEWGMARGIFILSNDSKMIRYSPYVRNVWR